MDLFRRKKVKDERIINLQNKIYKEIYILILIICSVSIVIKFYLYGFETQKVSTEMAILLAQALYFSYRTASLGIYSDEVEMHDRTSKIPMKRKNLIIGMITGVVLALGIATQSAILYGERTGSTIYTFFLVFFTCIMMYVPFFILIMLITHSVMKKKSDKAVSKQLGDLDNDGDLNEKH